MIEDRRYKLEYLLTSSPGISMDEIPFKLAVSKATAKPYIEALRDRFEIPVKYDWHTNGYLIENSDNCDAKRLGRRAELTRLWFISGEALALLMEFLVAAKCIGQVLNLLRIVHAGSAVRFCTKHKKYIRCPMVVWYLKYPTLTHFNRRSVELWC